MTREDWLQQLTTRIGVQIFEPAGYPLPPHLRVSVGFPSRGGTALANRKIGECWHADTSEDECFEIFISPVLGTPLQAAETLVHELVHAVLPADVRHGREFRRLARTLGLEGKPTATYASAELAAVLEALYPGDYPHAELKPRIPVRKQSTRMRKAMCAECGYTVRVARQWLTVGIPQCPVHGAPLAVEPEPAVPALAGSVA